MHPRVKTAGANDDYTLTLGFTNGEVRRFDMRPYLHHGLFSELQDLSYFKAVRVVMGTVAWPHEQDVCPDTLYEGSVPLGGRSSPRRLASARRPAVKPRVLGVIPRVSGKV